ncbi:MAG: AAA family ATPase [Gammaproteobacteria bacterium]|nr:AAA family ATPase [Gammaproteobacteria bacterium]
MLIRRLKISGLLSFGPDGVDLPMEPLNVLIGPNGSGKSNFLEAIALLKAVPREVLEPISRTGGLREWLWNGPDAPNSITMEAEVHCPRGGDLRHSLTLAEANGRPEVISEQIEPIGKFAGRRAALSSYRRPQDERTESYLPQDSPDSANPNSADGMLAQFREDGIHFRSDCLPEVSLVSLANPRDYPALWYLNIQYEAIRLYRDWSFGPGTELRRPASAHDRADFLTKDGANLASVLSNLPGENRRRLVASLQKLYDGIVDIKCSVVGGNVTLFLEEKGNREIPAARLSDGTFRYLCLLAILLHPQPPPLVVLDQPELGLHPDLLPTLADLLLAASERCQLIVTTHSDALVDALTDTPESVVVCEKHDGQTEMRRLDKDELVKRLKGGTLGDLWSSGILGGNRW